MSCLFNPVVNELKYSPSVFACLPGISVLTGVALLALLVPFNAWIANQQKRFQEENLVLKDARIKMVNEILNGMKVTLLFLFSLCELCMDSSLWVLYALLCLNGVFIPLCECCLHSSVWMVSGLFCVKCVWILQCEWSDKTDTRSVIIFFFKLMVLIVCRCIYLSYNQTCELMLSIDQSNDRQQNVQMQIWRWAGVK